MKFTRNLMLITGFILLQTIIKAQSPIATHSVEVTWNKTASIIFPCGITTVDRGSRDLLAQKAKGVENVLQLKAGRRNFPETNLTVITMDGILHQFTVNYENEPESFVLSIAPLKQKDTKQSVLIFSAAMTHAQMKACTEAIVGAKPPLLSRSIGKYNMKLSLQGIYIKDDVIFCHLAIQNDSNIPYDTELLRFYIKDRQKVKRTASQEVALQPLYRYGDENRINGKTTRQVVYALPKFTIPNAKHLVIELMEHNGGRHLTLTIPNKRLINARALDTNDSRVSTKD